MPQRLTVFTDSDWAGCRRTRRSTSGGALMNGTHLLRHWSRTQAGVALSSGEAELIAVVKGSCEILGMQCVFSELGRNTECTVQTDSSAAKGITMRTGKGRLKHVQTQHLWVQEKAAKGEITYTKCPRVCNPADLMTHHWIVSDGAKHLSKMQCQ